MKIHRSQKRAIEVHAGSTLEWTIAGVIGIVLGLCTLSISALPSRWAILLFLAVLSPFIAMIIGNVRRLLLAIIILDISFQLDINLGYQAEAAELGALGGLSISVTTIALVVLYAMWVGKLLTRMEPRTTPLLRPILPFASYLAFTALSVLVARDFTLAKFDIFLLLQMFLLYVYIVGTVRTPQDMLFIVTMLLIGVVFQGLIIIGVHITGKDSSIAGISTVVDESYYNTGQPLRPGGTLGSPNNAASFLSLLLIVSISVLMTRLGRWHKRLAILAFSLGGIGLILTQSRGGWIAFVSSAIILCLLAWRRGWLSPKIFLAVAIVATLVALLFQDIVATRLFGDDNENAYSRIPLMELAFRMIEDNPVLGVGANNFAIMMEKYLASNSGTWLYVVHNKYLLVWAETGIGGLLTFMWFLLAIIGWGWRCSKSGDRFLSPLALGCTAAILGQMTHMLVEPFNSSVGLQLLYFVAGLVAAMYNLKEKNDFSSYVSPNRADTGTT